VNKLSNPKQEILRVENLKQYFKLGSGRNKAVNKAVDDISFTINKGEVFSLVGESGCGKTTTGRTIIKLYNSSGGEVFFEGTRIISDVKKAKADHKAIVDRITAIKEQKLKALAEMQGLSETEVNEEKARIQAAYDEEFNKSMNVLRLAKRDKRFVSVKDPHGLKEIAEIEKNERYQAIVNRYRLANDAILEQIDELQKAIKSAEGALERASDSEKKAAKADLANKTNELSKLKKEISLNAIRQKQDVLNLKYQLTHKNKLLMRKMQMIFQDPIASLNPRMTVKEIIAEGLRINGVRNEAEIDARVKEALKTVGLLPEHASRYPHEFSGGQRQRIGIARALVVEPTFIIADEPISALDVSIRAQIINLLNDLRETKGITILFIAHDLSVVKYFTDRLAVMYFGKIVEIGDKDSIFNNPLHPYTKTLLESIPLPDPAYERTRVRRARYNPKEEHDYSVEKPTLREIEPDHFVLCNTVEFEKYQAKIKANK
jgi:oligopeptide transport system ATP-binding protein